MLRIGSVHLRIYKYFSYKLILFLLIYKICSQEIWGVVITIPISASDHNIFDNTGSSNRIFSINSGIGGSLTLKSGIFDAREFPENNYPLISTSKINPDPIQDYTINIATTGIASLHNPVIDMGFTNVIGNINIINGYINSDLELTQNGGSIYRTSLPPDQTAHPINYGTVINFKDSKAKLNLIQTNSDLNRIHGDIQGSNNGDIITLNGGNLFGRVILGNGNNHLTMTNNASIDVSRGLMVDEYAIIGNSGNNIININDQAKIIAGNNKEAIYVASNNAVGNDLGLSNITITGTPEIVGGINLPEVANTLNIGTNQFAAQYTTKGDLNNLQLIELNAPINDRTLFNVNNKITGINKFIIRYNTTAKVNKGHINNSNVGNNDPTLGITNNGSLFLDNLATIYGLKVNNQNFIQINNSNMLFRELFNNFGELNLQAGSDLSAITPNSDNLNNNYGNTINIDQSSSIGKLGRLGTINNYGKIIINGELYLDRLINKNDASITMTDGAKCNVSGNGNIDNQGNFYIPNGAIIDATLFNQNNDLQIGGTINAPIVLGNKGSTIEILAGKVNSITSGSNNDVLEITGPFTTNGTIKNIQKIHLLNEQITIKDLVSGVNNAFLVRAGVKLNIVDNGDLSGEGTIDNLGIINIKRVITEGSIGSNNPMGNFNNQGTLNLLGGYLSVGNFSNNDPTAILNINQGSMLVTNFNNTLGELNISNGDLSSNTKSTTASNNTQGTLNNATNQVIHLTNKGTLGNSQAFNQIVNNGVFNIVDLALVKTNNFTNDRILSNNTNSVELNIIGGQLLIGINNNSTNTDPNANTNSAANTTAGQFNNIVGTLKITSSMNSNGDLSSGDPKSLASLKNGKDQLIIVDEKATIGKLVALGTVTNKGKIIANGGDIIIGDLINGNSDNNDYAELILNRGIFRVGNINNDLGTIKILNTIDSLGNTYIADLSSAIIEQPSGLTNGKNQIIDIQTGTIGKNSPLGEVNNNGIINVNNDINVGAFSNKANAKLNITGGIVKVGNIINDGTITIESDSDRSADLSSINKDLPSSLKNSANNVINILGNGTIGLESPLGNVENQGIINASGGDLIIGDLLQGGLNTPDPEINFNINSGRIFVGNITNNQQNIIAIQGGDLSSYNPMNHSNLINRGGKILISGTGTIGKFSQSSLGKVSNYDNGLFEANGGDVNLDLFINGFEGSNISSTNTNGNLNIQNGICRIGELRNVSGTVNIDNGDLSANSNYTGSITNAIDQNITIQNLGSIGFNLPFKEFINSGTINLDGGRLNAGDFTNNAETAVLNVFNRGMMTIKKLTNKAGKISIGKHNEEGDLSGVNDNEGELINYSIFEITENGTLGKIKPLGDLNNYGQLNATSSIFKIKNLNNYGNFDLINNSNVWGDASKISMQKVINQGTINLRSINNLNSISLGQVHNLNNATLHIDSQLELTGSLVNDGLINIQNNLKLMKPGIPLVPDLFINRGVVNVLQPSVIEQGHYYLADSGEHVVNIANGETPCLTLRQGDAMIANGATIKINNSNEEFIRDQQIFNIINVVNSTNQLKVMNLNGINISGATSLIGYDVLAVDLTKNLSIIAHRKKMQNILDQDHDYMSSLAASLDLLMEQKPYQNINLRSVLSDLEGLKTEQEIISAIKQLYPELEFGEITLAANNFIVAEATAQRTDFLARNNHNYLNTGYNAGNMYVNDGFWVKGLGGSIKQGNREQHTGYNANTGGIVFGLDTKFLEDFWLGLGFSRVATLMKSKDYPSKKTTLNSYQVTAYATFTPDPFYMDLFSSIAFNSYKTRRDILFTVPNQVATAKFNGVQPSVKFDLGYIFQMNNFKIVPNGTVKYSVLFQNPYNEDPISMVGLNKVSSDRLTQLEMGLGVKLGLLNNEDAERVYNYYTHFMLLHDFKAAPRVTTAEFVGGGGSFKILGSTPDRNTYNFGLGMNLKYKDRLQFSINYDLRKKTKFIGHAGSIMVRYDL